MCVFSSVNHSKSIITDNETEIANRRSQSIHALLPKIPHPPHLRRSLRNVHLQNPLQRLRRPLHLCPCNRHHQPHRRKPSAHPVRPPTPFLPPLPLPPTTLTLNKPDDSQTNPPPATACPKTSAATVSVAGSSSPNTTPHSSHPSSPSPSSPGPPPRPRTTGPPSSTTVHSSNTISPRTAAVSPPATPV